MAARDEEIADAIVTEINAGTWTIGTVVASRKTTAEYTAEERQNVCVSVMVFSSEIDLLNRGKKRRRISVDVGYQKNVDPDDATALSEMNEFGDELAEYFAGDSTDKGQRTVSTVSTCKVLGAARSPFYSPEDIKRGVYFSRVLLSLLEVTNL